MAGRPGVNNTTVLTQWLRAEEPTSWWWYRDNPRTTAWGAEVGSQEGAYPSVVDAALEVARNLDGPAYGYPRIARDLAASAPPSTTARAIWRPPGRRPLRLRRVLGHLAGPVGRGAPQCLA